MDRTILTTVMAGGRPEGYAENCEILHHGCLRRMSEHVQPNEQAFFLRFRHRGRFIPEIEPDVDWRQEGNSCLVRVFAQSSEDALAVLESEYGDAIDRGVAVEIESRQPIEIINQFLRRIVVWPPHVAHAVDVSVETKAA